MQSNFLYPSTHTRSCFSWNPHKPKIIQHNFEQQRLLNNNQTPNLKTSVNSPCVSKFLKTSLNFGEEKLNKQEETTLPFYLQVSVRNSNCHFRYIWDSKDLNLVSVDGNAFSIFDFDCNFEDAVQKLVRICISAIRNFFLPREVSRVKWKFVHSVSSSALQVLATQAMLRAIGIGNSRSLPLAAALNWVLKDGLGRLCRCIYTASLASSFDTNLKKVRFCTSVLFSLSIGVELLTPVFPQYFLMLASIANIAKQISLACYLSTSTVVFVVSRGSFGNNLSTSPLRLLFIEALQLLKTLARFLQKDRLQAGLPFVMYPIFSVVDLFGIYQGLKHVHLQTLTKDRLDIVISTWIQQGFVPSPEEVSKQEGIG